MPGVADIEAIDDREAAVVFCRHLGGLSNLVLAVSGGSDSMALMGLMARWSDGLEPHLRPGIHVVTVDHALRPEAAAEADFVLQEAAALGLPAQKLRWDGPHPKTGLPAAARDARYGLLCDVCRRQSAVLVTAHTLDDQAETFVMALARGAGVDGLSAMQPVTCFKGVSIIRPLLETGRSRLRATLQRAGARWMEDPTNRDTGYERVRVREALAILQQQGVSGADLARSSRRLSRARAALVHAAAALERDTVTHQAAGFAGIARGRFLQAPDEIQLRCLLAVARAYGGGMEQSLAGAEDLLSWMQSGAEKARTFAGCRIVRRTAEFVVGREASRVNETPVQLASGQSVAEWDRRYHVSTGCKAGPVELMALREVPGKLQPQRPPVVPEFVWQGLPAVIDAENRVMLPCDSRRPGSTGEQNIVFRLLADRKPVHS